MTKPDKNGDLVIAICPDCNCHSVCDPGWMKGVCKTISLRCDNCTDGKYKPHLLARFVPIPP